LLEVPPFLLIIPDQNSGRREAFSSSWLNNSMEVPFEVFHF